MWEYTYIGGAGDDTCQLSVVAVTVNSLPCSSLYHQLYIDPSILASCHLMRWGICTGGLCSQVLFAMDMTQCWAESPSYPTAVEMNDRIGLRYTVDKDLQEL